MTQSDWEVYSDDVALARYAVISPLVSRVMDNKERTLARADILKSVHQFPDGQSHRISCRCLERWFQYYMFGHINTDGEVVSEPGITSLKPMPRNDRGKPRKLEPALVVRAVELRREEPSRTTSAIIELLKTAALAAGQAEPKICEGTLAYHLRQRKATKKDIKKEGRAFPRYEHPRRNSSWQADWSQGIRLPDPQNPSKTKLCHLHAVLDDHSRYVVHAEFYFRQNLPYLEDCFRKSILHGGICSILYVDNGKVYHSRALKLITARLATQLVFATPYAPEGKGKIERWFGTLKRSFYPEAQRAGILTLEELNQFLWAWIKGVYHAREHSETKQTPKARWDAGADQVRYPEPAQLVDLFLWEAKRQVDKSGCIKLSGNLYSVAEHLVGQEVTIRFDPFDLSRIRLYEDGQFTGAIEPQTLVSRTLRKSSKKRPGRESPLPSSTDYRNKLAADYREQAQSIQKQVRGSRGCGLTQGEFLALLEESLGRQITPTETNSAGEFFQRNAPLGENQVRSALRKAIAIKSASLHMRYYLDAVKTARLDERAS
jgi:putative transposase